MKRILFVVVLILAVNSFPQENYKGKVSLTFNGEKIELPIISVNLLKDEQISIRIRAERNEDSLHQMISMNLTFKDLSTNDEKNDNYHDMQLNVLNNKRKGNQNNLEEFAFDFNKQQLYYRTENNDEKMNWEIRSFHVKKERTKILFNDSSLVIAGSMSFEGYTKKSKNEIITIVEIKDFSYEIVI